MKYPYIICRQSVRQELRDLIIIFDQVRNTAAIANLIRENKTPQIPSIIETNAKTGMVSMDSSVKQLYLDMKVSEDTAKRTMKHPQILFG